MKIKFNSYPALWAAGFISLLLLTDFFGAWAAMISYGIVKG